MALGSQMSSMCMESDTLSNNQGRRMRTVKAAAVQISPVIHSRGDGPKLLRLVVGNPLIMKEMARAVPDAASYAPVTILIDERADGVHLSYDSVASLLAPYGCGPALAVAADLDTKVEALLEAAAR